MIDSQLIWFDIYIDGAHAGTYSIDENVLPAITVEDITQYIADHIKTYIGESLTGAYVSDRLLASGTFVNHHAVILQYPSRIRRLHIGNIRRV